MEGGSGGDGNSDDNGNFSNNSEGGVDGGGFSHKAKERDIN